MKIKWLMAVRTFRHTGDVGKKMLNNINSSSVGTKTNVFSQ